jgi:hypothetical protein
MDTPWTLPELVAEVATRIAALPAPKNGQVRAVPDERTVRYYGTLGLLDRPSAMRGRTALYGTKHVAQVVAIKRLQTMGRSLSEIQQVWSTLDDATLTRMSGVEMPAMVTPPARAAFWKREPGRSDPAAGTGAAASGPGEARGSGSMPSSDEVLGSDVFPAARVVRLGGAVARRSSGAPGGPNAGPGASSAGSGAGATAVELRIELAPQIVLSLSVTDESVVISPADVRALRAAAAPLLAELASRRLASHSGGEEP